MHRRLLMLLLALVFLLPGAVAVAQDADPAATDDTSTVAPAPSDASPDATPPDATTSDAGADATTPSAAPSLFLQVVDPADTDVEVPLATTSLVINGSTIPGAVVSVDGFLTDVDPQGAFSAPVVLDEGANEVQVLASDADGNTVETHLYITRGD